MCIKMKYWIYFLSISFVVFGKEVVRLSSSNQVKMFSAPLAKELIHSWIEIQQGVYPRVKPITDVIPLGEDITLFIYFKEPNNVYDVKIAECWAYDNEKSKTEGNRMNIYNINKRNSTTNNFWKKFKYYEDKIPITILFAGLKTFKFPESDKVFLTCDIMLCYRRCNEEQHKLN